MHHIHPKDGARLPRLAEHIQEFLIYITLQVKNSLPNTCHSKLQNYKAN